MTRAPLASARRWGSRILVAVLLLATVSVLAVLIVIPRATHGSAMTVLSGSMTPDLPVGSVVVIRPVDTATLQVGDVATYQTAPGRAEYVTHRIVGIDTGTTPTSFRFKGDANRIADVKPVPSTAIRGEVWFQVPYLGTVRDAVGGRLVIYAAMVGLLSYAALQIVGAWRERGRSDEDKRTSDYEHVAFSPGAVLHLSPVEQDELSAVQAGQTADGRVIVRLPRALLDRNAMLATHEPIASSEETGPVASHV